MNPKILSEITGNTQGMRLRMKPPRKPKSRNLASPVGRDSIEPTDELVNSILDILITNVTKTGD